MRFNKAWVDEWVPNTLSAQELSDKITMAGLEVDTIEPVCGQFDKVVVGLVKTCVAHPDSNHLHVTEIDIGSGELLQIVCGAPNCRAGLKTAVALVGAKLPGIEIKPAKLRGVESFGMCCSYKELGMSEESDGIIELPEDAPLGADLHDYFKLNDAAIEVDLTSNRPDCLSIRGVARELGVLINQDVKAPVINKVSAALDESFKVQVEAPADCPRYVCRVLRGLNPKAQSPVWMTERLRRCGIRPLSAIVDVTNYVMLELGQPLHSFDLNAVKGSIIVRHAKAGEKLQLLSEAEVELKPDTLIIADEEGPAALAGIFGGLRTGIHNDTQDVLLESAFFAPDAIKGRAREYGLNTDASHRFERGVDPSLQELALERATALLLEIAGGKAGPLSSSLHAEYLPKYQRIPLRRDRLAMILGEKVADDEVFNILQRLELKPERTAEGWSAISPSFRFDIAIEEDLIEEVARIHGYGLIPNRAPEGRLVMGSHREAHLSERRLRAALMDAGYQEAITYSFTDPKVLAVFSSIKPIVLNAPISPELSAMRTTLLAGLTQAAKYNLNRQQKRIRLFEIGLSYITDQKAVNGVRQDAMVSGLALGPAEGEAWCQSDRAVDFFDIKGDVQSLIDLTAHPQAFSFKPTKNTYLHPGQGADIYLNDELVGSVGMLHPSVLKALGLKQNAAVFEIKLEALLERSIPVFKPISKFPSIRRDFAFVVDSSIAADAIVGAIRAALGQRLTEVKIFDVFSGGDLEGKRSLALGITLQDQDQTLSEAEVQQATDTVLKVMSEQFNAALRQ